WEWCWAVSPPVHGNEPSSASTWHGSRCSRSASCGRGRLPLLPVDEPEHRRLAGAKRPSIDDVPAGEVHLRNRPGAVAANRLHVSHVAEPTLPRHHDGAHLRRLSLWEPVGPSVGPPLDGVAEPWDVALVRDVPGAVAEREMIRPLTSRRPNGRG